MKIISGINALTDQFRIAATGVLADGNHRPDTEITGGYLYYRKDALTSRQAPMDRQWMVVISTSLNADTPAVSPPMGNATGSVIADTSGRAPARLDQRVSGSIRSGWAPQ